MAGHLPTVKGLYRTVGGPNEAKTPQAVSCEVALEICPEAVARTVHPFLDQDVERRHASRRQQPAPWCVLVYDLRVKRRQITSDFPCSKVRQRTILHDFVRLNHAVQPQWGSGGRGFKSCRPDLTDVTLRVQHQY